MVQAAVLAALGKPSCRLSMPPARRHFEVEQEVEVPVLKPGDQGSATSLLALTGV